MKVVDFKVPKIKKEAFRFQEDSGRRFYDQLHQHSEIQIMLIVKGEGTLIAGDYVGRFGANDLFVIGSGQPHVFRSDRSYYDPKSKLIVKALSLYFNEDYLSDSFWELDEMKMVRKFTARALLGMRVTGKNGIEIGSMIHQLKKAHGLNRLILFFSVLKMLTEANKARPLSISSDNRFRQEESRRMNSILSFTFSESHRQIYIREVAREASLSPEAFCRYFKLHTRKTYTNFLNEVRVSEACKMLINKDSTIEDVCYQCGFSNLSNFNRIFKRIIGKTPSKYCAQ